MKSVFASSFMGIGLASSILGQSQVAKPATVSAPIVPSPASLGRYQIVFGPHARADTFLIDTQTGKIWTRTVFTFLQGEPQAWLPEPHLENEKEEQEWVNLHPKKASALPPTKTTPDGRPIMPDLNTFPGSLAEYNAAVAKYEADFEKWALEKARAK